MSYVRQRTWLENGPVRRGMGSVLSAPPACDSWWSMLDPAAWVDCPWLAHPLADPAAEAAAGLYQQVQYGAIPAVAPPPAPNAPQTAAQMQGAWDVSQSASQPGQIGAAQQAVINQAVADGSYNPAGNLPATADDLSKFWSQYGTYLIIGGLGLAAYLALSVAKRSI